jgi:hypothetical protein
VVAFVNIFTEVPFNDDYIQKHYSDLFWLLNSFQVFCVSVVTSDSTAKLLHVLYDGVAKVLTLQAVKCSSSLLWISNGALKEGLSSSAKCSHGFHCLNLNLYKEGPLTLHVDMQFSFLGISFSLPSFEILLIFQV